MREKKALIWQKKYLTKLLYHVATSPQSTTTKCLSMDEPPTGQKINKFRSVSRLTSKTSFYYLPVAAKVQIPTRIPEKIVVALFSSIIVNSGVLVDYTEVKVGTFSC